ncbi:MAG TPA: hypothetical protein VKY40_01720, partial [Halanaerobiales bacterium]|nr:hypothetical protein [Halanaerobiales bacterium]
EMKYVFEINGGFRFGRTSIQDSVRGMGEQNQLITSGIINEYGINHFLVYPEVSLHIMPEERFNFKLAWKPQYFISAFDEPKLLDGTTKWINSYEMIMNIKTGDKGKIFARWRLNNQWGEIEKHFHQIQLGYSFYILISSIIHPYNSSSSSFFLFSALGHPD